MDISLIGVIRDRPRFAEKSAPSFASPNHEFRNKNKLYPACPAPPSQPHSKSIGLLSSLSGPLPNRPACPRLARRPSAVSIPSWKCSPSKVTKIKAFWTEHPGLRSAFPKRNVISLSSAYSNGMATLRMERQYKAYGCVISEKSMAQTPLIPLTLGNADLSSLKINRVCLIDSLINIPWIYRT